MSKNYKKNSINVSKRDEFDNKLKETKQNNIEYKTIKDIKVKNYNNLSRSLTKQIGKINMKIKEENNEELENNQSNIMGDIQKENEIYKEQLKQLEEKILIKDKEYSDNILKYRAEIENKEKKIKKLININTNLKNSLEVLTQRLDNIIINTNTKKIKIQNNKSSESQNLQDLQHQLEIKEKELKNQQQLINILKKDNKNLNSLLNNFHMSDNDLNLANKIQSQYKEIMNLQKNLKEYKKLIHCTSQENLKTKDLKLSQEENKESINNNKKNKKLYLNEIYTTKKTFHGINFNLNNLKTFDKNKENSSFKKRQEYQGINFYVNHEKNILETIFNIDERDALKNILGEGTRFNEFINKLNILDKASKIKEKEMNSKIKIIENKLKQKEKELIKSNEQIKEKENIIIDLNIKNKELIKNNNELMNQMNYLTQILNELEQKNQNIEKQNKEIKNTIFNIDGIIEAKSKEGNIIPIIKEIKNNDTSKNESLKEEKNRSFSISIVDTNEQQLDS